MRTAFDALCDSTLAGANFGLLYGALAPTDDSGKLPLNNERDKWLRRLEDVSIDDDYGAFYARWKAALTGAEIRQVQTVSRLLLGHGNPSGTDIGLTVHRTWGVPVIPGSALKGLLAHYVDAVYGPANSELRPWEQPDGERDRTAFQASVWSGSRILRGPGSAFRDIFGAPEAEEDDLMRMNGFGDVGPAGGQVTFFDAMYVPQSASGKPFTIDVLTVHQKPYYDSSGACWPNDYESPTPVPFLTLKPGVELLLALSGPERLAKLASQLMLAALKEWGIGGKTSSGYGRIGTREKSQTPLHKAGETVEVNRVEDPSGRGRLWFEADDGFGGVVAAGTPPSIEIGERTRLEIANVNKPGGYNFRLPGLSSSQSKGRSKK